MPGAVNVLGLGHFQLAALLAEADLAITGDSAPLHLAAAVGQRGICLFGPTDPRTTLRFYDRWTPIWKPLDAQERAKCWCPCYYIPSNYYRGHGFCADEGECMKAITPAEVLDAALKMLGEAQEGPNSAQGARQARVEAVDGPVAVAAAQEALNGR
jgi:ADP-heptose:LPS heptosyltransferase